MSILIERKLEALKKYLEIKEAQEISVNQPQEVFINYGNRVERIVDKKIDELFIKNFIVQMASINNLEVDEATNPILSAKIPYKNKTYRMQAVLGPSVLNSGMQFTIRIPAKEVWPLSAYISDQSIRDKLVNDLKGHQANSEVVYRKNILIGAGVGIGKTSFLNSLIGYCDKNDRVISVEDVPELNLNRFQNKVMYLIPNNNTKTNLSYSAFINNAMRQAFKRIFIGEISINNTDSFMRMLNSGHGGCISTIHANSCEKVLDALIMNLRLSGFKGTNKDIKTYCKNNLDLIIHLTRDENFNYQTEILEL